MRIFIDDERFPADNSGEWCIVRSSQAAIDLVILQGYPEFISFDHDLGGEDTSIKFVDWMINNTLDTGNFTQFPKNFSVHSQNPIGTKNIIGKMTGFINFCQGK